MAVNHHLLFAFEAKDQLLSLSHSVEGELKSTITIRSALLMSFACRTSSRCDGNRSILVNVTHPQAGTSEGHSAETIAGILCR
ncbi:MAG: hypothetical protein MZV63_11580 [Marinilabiliales bacterium]|nr:hypothetical protein [Marinilabiliales bacterium]